MRRFLWIWLTLLGAFWVARTAVSLAASGWVGWSGEAWLQLVTVPALQALVVAWITRDRGIGPADLLRPLATPWLAFWLAWDALVVTLGALLPESPFFSPYGGGNLLGVHNLLKGLVAGLVAASLAPRRRSVREQAWLGLFALALPALASAFLFPWPETLALRLAPPLSPLLARLVVAGALLVVAVGLLLRAQAIWSRFPGAARLLDLAACLLLLASVLAGAHLALHPGEPWPLLARAGAAFALSAALVATVRAFWSERQERRAD